MAYRGPESIKRRLPPAIAGGSQLRVAFIDCLPAGKRGSAIPVCVPSGLTGTVSGQSAWVQQDRGPASGGAGVGDDLAVVV